jgi:hypothetical protein
VYGGTAALVSAPVIDKRVDAIGPTWTVADLDATVGAQFTNRDPHRTFACTDVLSLT